MSTASKRRTVFVIAWLLILGLSAFFGRVLRSHRFASDERLYGIWDVHFVDRRQTRYVDTWILSPSGFFGPTLEHRRPYPAVYWGVHRGQFIYDTDAQQPMRYDIHIRTRDGILLSQQDEPALFLKRARQ